MSSSDITSVYTGEDITVSRGSKNGNNVSSSVSTETLSEYEEVIVGDWSKGEKNSTLWDISQNYGVSISELEAANPWIAENGGVYHPGQTLLVPINTSVGSEMSGEREHLNTTIGGSFLGEENSKVTDAVEEMVLDEVYDSEEISTNNNVDLETDVSNSDTSTRNEPIDIKNLSRDEFIETIAPGAIRSFEEDGVLPSITIAQAILETGWGKHSIGNNIFGIKGKGNVATTQEEVNGQLITIQDSFRAYDSISDSIVDHGKLLTKERYANVIEACKNGDYKQACVQLQKCGYATDSSYPSKLISIIESNDLTRFDQV